MTAVVTQVNKTGVSVTTDSSGIVVLQPQKVMAVNVQSEGLIGPPGLQGPAGAGGNGFGSVDLSDQTPVPLTLIQDVATRIIKNLVPSSANFNPLGAPFAGFSFWDGQLLRARALGDIYLFKFDYAITPYLRGATVRFSVLPGGDPNFNFGPAAVATTVDAGVQEIGSVTFSTQARSRFVNSGAQILITMSCPGTLDLFSPEITPLGYKV